MTNAEKLKKIIAERLSGFLILEGVPPDSVEVVVNYPHSMARLNIEPSEIEKVFEEERNETN